MLVSLVALLGLSSCVEGLTLRLTDYGSIPTDGSGRIFITAIGLDDATTTDGDADALLCQSDVPAAPGSGDWYLHPTQQSTDDGDRIQSTDPRGWSRNRGSGLNSHRLVRLKRHSTITAEEGVFTCHVLGDNNTPISVGIYYPISVSVSIQVLSRRQGTFRVTCTATGGTVLTSSFSGPGGVNLVLQPEGAVGRTGQNTYSVASGTISGRSNGDTYQCTATDPLSSPASSDSAVLAVAGDPIMVLLNLITPTAASVAWVQPSRGATVTGYVVHYTSDGTTDRMKSVAASSTSTDITGLTSGLTYTISVEATSEHLSGESKDRTIAVGTPLETPVGVTVSDEGSTSVTVSWQAVEDADRYTVTFNQTIGNGLCLEASHTASVSVTDNSTSIAVGQDVDKGDDDMLRAYTTYAITVVAESDESEWISSESSVPVTVTTAQTSVAVAPRNVKATVVSSTVISVQWDGLFPCRLVNGLIVKYRVQYTAESSGEVQHTDESGDWDDGGETSLTGLTPFTNYSIQVAAVNEQDDVGPYSDPAINAQTEEDFPGPVAITSLSSFFKITITWNPPDMPNGIIIAYEVSYRPTDSSQPNTRLNTTDLATSFTTQSDLELGTEFNFSVRAFTKVGPGDATSVVVSTLERPPAVEGVMLTVDDTSATVTWNDLFIPNFSIDYYTVVYTLLSQQQNEEMSTSPATSGVDIDLDTTAIYQFQVFATVTVSDKAVDGEKSTPVYFTRPLVVHGVEVMVLNDTSVTVSWNEVQDFSIDYYTVVYSQVTEGQNGEKSARFPPPAISGVITDLDSTAIYQFQVVATVTVGNITLEGDGNAALRFGVDKSRGEDGDGGDRKTSDGSSNAGGTAAGVAVAILAVVVIIGIVVVVAYVLKKRQKLSYRLSSPENSVTPLHYTEATDNMASGEKTAEPMITKFPDDKHVLEGEKVAFRVKVTGAPPPELTWYHNGEEVVADYSKELAEDGSLTMPSAETKHSGIYQLVAKNRAGSMEKEVKLFVKQEGQQSPHIAKKQIHFFRIPVEEFGDYISKSHANDNRDFRDQYAELDKDGDHPITIGSSPSLKPFNRFANITVYDDNRIILRPIEGHLDCQREFINACYVDGYKFRNKFIATQGPLPKTTVDFWRLVWQEKPPTIVMVTNLMEGKRTKCHQYWPEIGAQYFGPFQVTITDQQILADYTTRSLLVQLTGSSERALKVTQFHFTAWPDHGVPDYATPILAFHKKLKKQHRPSKGPLLMHCSAGVGRTGTLITIDRVLDQIQKENVVDVAGTIQHLRNQRMKMVQSPEQYIFIHDAILEAMTCGDTQINAIDLRRTIQKLSQRDPETRLTGFESQFKVLDQVSPNPREILRQKALDNPTRNRSEDFLPSDCWRVVLKGESVDYIHAVVVNGYKQQRAFIIAQSPMQSTAKDFWKMISDRKCGVIVMLCDLVESGKEVCHQYWPSTDSIEVGEFTIFLLGEEKMEGFIIRTLSVLHKKSGQVHHVVQLHMTNWAPDGRCSNLTFVTDVIGEMSKIQRRTGNHSVVVHCSDTVSRSGMFCAIATTIERCKTEGVVDVFQVVKALRARKPGAVRTVSHYHTLFEAVLVYLDSFDTYSNFKQDL